MKNKRRKTTRDMQKLELIPPHPTQRSRRDRLLIGIQQQLLTKNFQCGGKSNVDICKDSIILTSASEICF